MYYILVNINIVFKDLLNILNAILYKLNISEVIWDRTILTLYQYYNYNQCIVMVGVRGTGAALCRSSGLLQPPYFLMFLLLSRCSAGLALTVTASSGSTASWSAANASGSMRLTLDSRRYVLVCVCVCVSMQVNVTNYLPRLLGWIFDVQSH